MKTWVKLYTDINRNPDVGTLTWAQRGIWSALLALAGQIDDRDERGRETGKLDTPEKVAWSIRCELGELSEAIQVFMGGERKWLEDRDGVLYIRKYRERQGRPPSARPDAVAGRVKRHRAKQTDERNEGVTTLQDDVTRAQRPVTPPDSDSDSDTDPETDSDPESGGASAPPHALPSSAHAETATIEDLCEIFCQLTGIPPPEDQPGLTRSDVRTLWRLPLRQIGDMADRAPGLAQEIMADAYRELKATSDGKTMRVSSPKSLLKTAIDRQGEVRRKADGRRYVKGKYGERVKH